MCGIIGYIGNKKAKNILIKGLTLLEYRGYDSSGITLIEENKLLTIKSIGKLQNLKNKISDMNTISNIGIGHTRWATHGIPSIENAHPHNSNNNQISLVHNGIIENYIEIKEELTKKGIGFCGKTDTEVIVKYIEYIYKNNPLEVLEHLNNKLKGSYALSIIFLDEKNKIYFIKKDSPLIIGLGTDENFLSSDSSSISNFTNQVIYLNNNEYGYITKDEVNIYANKKKINYSIMHIKQCEIIDKSKSFPTHLENEIHQTSQTVENILNKYIVSNNIIFDHILKKQLLNTHSINIFGCGSSYNVGLIGKYLFEKLCKIPTNVYVGSEYYNHIDNNSLSIFISQSGETADLLSLIPKINGYKLGIINVRNSSISNLMDSNLFLDCGSEISVATTKAYIGQLTILYLLSIYTSFNKKIINKEKYITYINEIKLIPNKINLILNNHNQIKDFSEILSQYKNVFFIGRELDYLTCIEGSLKLKEITYIHSEAISSGELKHGTISLIDENVYVISLLSSIYKHKTLSNIEEIKSRNGKVYTISNDDYSDYIIPTTLDIFYPLLEIIPLQLLALYTGKNLNVDIDKPRNLAKSVTVE